MRRKRNERRRRRARRRTRRDRTRDGRVGLAHRGEPLISARLYSAATGTWGTATPLKEDAAQVGYSSTSAALDLRRRATVAWTVWDPVASALMLRTRTFR